MMGIGIIDARHKTDLNIPNEPFQMFERMVPAYNGKGWSYELQRFAPEKVTEMCFPDETYAIPCRKVVSLASAMEIGA